jgi:PAS domain S-box-containing protein
LEAVESVAQKGTAIIPVDAGGETGVLARAFARVMDEVNAKTVALEREVIEHLRTEAARKHHAGRERLFSAAVESSNDAIITQSLDGLITGWNPAAERLFGYAAAEAVGRHISLIVPADRLGEVDDIVRRISWGETIEQNETVRLRKDGTSVEVALSISPIKAASGAIIGISKTARDITEWNRTQRALQQQIEERRRIFETSQDLILVTNAHSGPGQSQFRRHPGILAGGDARSQRARLHLCRGYRACQPGSTRRRAGTTDPKLYLALRAQGRTDRDAVMDGNVVSAGQAVLLYRPRHDREPQGAGGFARERANGARHHRDLARRLRAGRPARRRQGLERAGRDPVRLVSRGSAGKEHL